MTLMGQICEYKTKAIDFIGSLPVQTFLYFFFVIIFQLLAYTVREPLELYFSNRIQADFIRKPFDSSHNCFNDIRRQADIYEWGNNVLWPGLFADMGPCNGVSSARTE